MRIVSLRRRARAWRRRRPAVAREKPNVEGAKGIGEGRLEDGAVARANGLVLRGRHWRRRVGAQRAVNVLVPPDLARFTDRHDTKPRDERGASRVRRNAGWVLAVPDQELTAKALRDLHPHVRREPGAGHDVCERRDEPAIELGDRTGVALCAGAREVEITHREVGRRGQSPEALQVLGEGLVRDQDPGPRPSRFLHGGRQGKPGLAVGARGHGTAR
jgi:hypothetical protein